MSRPTMSLEERRRAFAESLRRSAPIRDPRVVAAFAAVPREAFLGPPPWRVLASAGRRLVDDPAELYEDVLVEIDATRGINNGEPQLWAFLFDRLRAAPGERALHVGAGTGYYTAILAELVGPEGHVTALEIEPDLAARARTNLRPWPWVDVQEGDGATADPGPVDIVVASAGATHPSPVWLDRLNDGGRIVFPLTDDWGRGAFLRITRRGRQFDAACLCGTAIYPCAGLRDPEASERLGRAIALDRDGLWAIRALHRGAPPAGARAWYAGPGFWLETAPEHERPAR